MPLTPLERSILDASKTTESLHRILRRLGTVEFSQGKVRVAYRVSGRGVVAALKIDNQLRRLLTLRDTFDTLRLSVETAVRAATLDAQDIGGKSSKRQLGFYGEKAPNQIAEALIEQEKSRQAEIAIGSSLAMVEAQIKQIEALAALSQVSPGLLSGENAVARVLNPAPVVNNSFSMAVSLTWVVYGLYVLATGGPDGLLSFLNLGEEFLEPLPYQFQAIAALDERTTPTCLAVHGQTVPIGDNFVLTRDPRPFGDELPGPPFHHYCRTALALFKAEFDLGLTDRMIEDAALILADKDAGKKTKEKHPADAFN